MDGSLRTLGVFTVSFDGADLTPPPTQKARALLAYLVWHQGADLARERIIECFWPGTDPERGRSSLNTALWSIRRCLRDGGVDAEEVFVANKRLVTWHAATRLDIRTFFELAQSEDASARRSAIELYGGDFLEGDYDEWSVAQRERASALYDATLAQIVASDGDLECARRLIDREAFDEAPYAIVARAELEAGRDAAASAIVKRCQAALAEAGLRPSAQFDAEFAALLAVRERADRGIALPFCGREAELEVLAQAFDRTVAGSGGVLLLSGAGGAGKSELLERAEPLARDRSMRVVGVTGMQDDPRPFGPWGACYQALTNTSLARVIADGGSALELARDIVDAIGVPAAVLVDDAHYLRADALQVLAGVAAATADRALEVVVATRSEGVRAIAGALPRASALEIGTLTYEQLREAVARIAPDGAATLAEFLFARSGGHAFFAKELLESLIRSGTVSVGRGAWTTAQPLDANVQTPTSIRTHIEGHLFAKGDDAATVACALALEASATAEDLIAVCGLGEARTLDAIDDLLAAGVLDQPARGTEFRFHHDLMRETAARCLNVGRRVRIHRAFADRFAGDDRRESLVRRANHLRWSGDVPAAVRAYAAAALALLEVNAWRDALELVQTAAESAESLRTTPETQALLARLNEVACKACFEGGDLERARRHVDAYLTHARESMDPALVCNALCERAALLSDELFDMKRAMADATEAATIGRGLGDDRLLCRVHFRRSFCAQVMGDEGQALCDARAALEAALRFGKPMVVAAGEVRLLTVLAIWQHFGPAVEAGARALEAAVRSGSRSEAGVRVSRAGLWYLLERWEDAERELQIASEILETVESRAMFPSMLGEPLPFIRYRYRVQAAVLALCRGRWDDALRLAQEVLASPIAQSFEKRRDIGQLIAVEALLGRRDAGDDLRAWDIARAVPDVPAANGLVGMSLYREVSLARAAARMHRDDAPALIDAAAQALEIETLSAPLDGDRAFEGLAESAEEIGARALAEAMRARADALRERRIRAAGDDWGRY